MAPKSHHMSCEFNDHYNASIAREIGAIKQRAISRMYIHCKQVNLMKEPTP